MYIITRSYVGRGEHLGASKKSSGGAGKSHKNLLGRAYAIHGRLDKVLIENRDFEKFKMYEKPKVETVEGFELIQEQKKVDDRENSALKPDNKSTVFFVLSAILAVFLFLPDNLLVSLLDLGYIL